MKQGIVLFAHGSRDPLWAMPIQTVAQTVQQQASGDALVRCAYLELMSPDLATVVQELVALGVDRIDITPMFLGVGKHAREDLPVLVNQLAQQYPQLHLHLHPSIGEHPLVIQTIADVVTTPTQITKPV